MRLLSKNTGQVYSGEFESESFDTAEHDAVAKFGTLNNIVTIYPEDYLDRMPWFWWLDGKRMEEARRKQEAEDNEQ